MASKVIYLAVRLEIYNSSKKEITDKDVDNVINNIDYEFKDFEDFKFETEIYSQIAPGQL